MKHYNSHTLFLQKCYITVHSPTCVCVAEQRSFSVEVLAFVSPDFHSTISDPFSDPEILLIYNPVLQHV